MQQRRKTSVTRVGTIGIGGDNPIRIQSMATTDTNDTAASVAQAERIIRAGGELVRFTTQGAREAENMKNISAALRADGYNTPLVADVHFTAHTADIAAQYCEKVRINPGNYVDPGRTFKHLEYTDEAYAEELGKIEKRFIPLLNICKAHHTALRIGVNHGSLSDRIMSRYGDTPTGIVESCMEFLRICQQQQFGNVVISIKASNTVVMVNTVRLLVETMDKADMHYPLHLGVTEAGEGEDGRIKSAVGIGALLTEGIGDTIRVSLSEEPENEIPVARQLVALIPSCSRLREMACAADSSALTVANSPNGEHCYIENSTIHLCLHADNWEQLQLKAAMTCGALLIDKRATQLEITTDNDGWNQQKAKLTALADAILQAARVKFSKTEYISCPGCGRTLYDLRTTIARIKAATQGMKGLKIGIMGCIVNGPGEMADADYGYVGAGRGRISLYRKKECVMKNIPEAEAVERLLDLIHRDKQAQLNG